MAAASEVAIWIVVGAIVGGYGVALLDRLASRVADPPADAETRVSDKRRNASQQTAHVLNSRRVRCVTCGLETSPGPMGGHLKSSGHAGSELT